MMKIIIVNIIWILILNVVPVSASLNNFDVNADTVRFICSELLGRPTNTSVTLTLCTDKDLDAYIEYGTQKSNFQYQTNTNSYQSNIPFNIVISDLTPNTTYYYRLRYRPKSTTLFLSREEHYFKTAKLKGSSFSFAVQADQHLDDITNPDLYKLTLLNILKNNPDFLLDLGDTFMSEKLENPTQDSITIRHLLMRSYFELVCHSVPLYLVIGNHEGELGWLLDGTAKSLAVLTSNTRTKYYPNPIPDNFYSGNTKSEEFVGLRQNYYSWEWGNALFVVIDPYWYTLQKPNKYIDNWSWTLGRDQYLWFKNVLENSQVKFKFVFAHQIVGGSSTEGRGGIEAVPFYEMGGKNQDNTWGFTSNRSGWELPIHQLMVKNHVNIFFHGHDHFYIKQELDGIVYQEVPQPGNPNYKTAGPADKYGYLSGKIIPNTGFLKITVSDSISKVDYVRSYLPATENQEQINGMIDYSYTITSNSVTSVEKRSEIPEHFSLEQNYPNPFNPTTVIGYQVGIETPANASVQLKVYDILGREVAILVDEITKPGNYLVRFNASQLPSGVYYYRLSANNDIIAKKMIFQK